MDVPTLMLSPAGGEGPVRVGTPPPRAESLSPGASSSRRLSASTSPSAGTSVSDVSSTSEAWTPSQQEQALDEPLMQLQKERRAEELAHVREQIPKRADLSGAQGAISKVERLQVIATQKHAWTKWTGIGSARNAGKEMQRRSGRRRSASLAKREDKAAAHIVAEHVAADEAAATEEPELPPPPPPPLDTGASATDSSTPHSSYSPSTPPAHLEMPAAALDQRPDTLVAPKPTYPWPFSTHSSSSDSEDHSSDGEMDSAYESTSDVSRVHEGDGGTGEAGARGSFSTLNLHHADPLTNKQMRRHLRHQRHLPQELQQQYNLGPLHIENPLGYREKGRRMRRAMGKYTPYTSGGEDTDEGEGRPVRTRSASSGSESGTPEGPTPGTSVPTTPKQERRPHMWSIKRRKEWNRAPAPETDMLAQWATDKGEDTGRLEQEQAQAVAEIAQQEENQKNDLVYDVLYENQRGILLFGMSKRFSSSVLFIMDPSPWTDEDGANTALNPATFQLPDPSWEWVHPAWLIDMTGDTDEDGWQYSGSFTGLRFWRRPMRFSPSSGPGKWKRGLYQYARARAERIEGRRRAKEATKPDAGFEAIMRTARMRSENWRGVPSIWTFVRRRRWVRLRRKVAQNVSRADLAYLLDAGRGGDASFAAPDAEDEADLTFDSAGSEDEELDAVGGTAGTRHHALIKRDVLVQRAKEELCMLLPFFLLPRSQSLELYRRERAQSVDAHARRHHMEILLRLESHVQNPFIGWTWVQQSMNEDGFSFVTTGLRSLERKYRQFGLPEKLRGRGMGVLPVLMPDVPRRDGYPAYVSLTREAVVDFNYEQLRQVFKFCSLDRLKLEMWNVWLGQTYYTDTSDETQYRETPSRLQLQQDWYRKWRRMLSLPNLQPYDIPLSMERTMRVRIYIVSRLPPWLLDIWDVLSMHLHDVLRMLDFEESRQELLALLRRLSAAEIPPSRRADSEGPTHARYDTSDPRWRRLPNGMLQLPTLPGLERLAAQHRTP